MILHSQNSSQHKLTCRHCVAHYTGSPWLENQMSPSEPLDFLRTWYNDSAFAECKPGNNEGYIFNKFYS